MYNVPRTYIPAFIVPFKYLTSLKNITFLHCLQATYFFFFFKIKEVIGIRYMAMPCKISWNGKISFKQGYFYRAPVYSTMMTLLVGYYLVRYLPNVLGPTLWHEQSDIFNESNFHKRLEIIFVCKVFS